MSYEGFEQALCAKGHYHHYDCYSTTPKKCQIKGCSEKIVWRNMVNLTNGSYEGNKRIDGFVTLKENGNNKCKCKCCGNVHNKVTSTYKIPKKGRII